MKVYKKAIISIILLFSCYLIFFFVQHRRLISVAVYEDVDINNFVKKVNIPVSSEIWLEEKKDTDYLEGYASRNSVTPGNVIEMIISTDQKELFGQVLRVGIQTAHPREGEVDGSLVQDLGRIKEDRISIVVKEEWKPGVYIVRIKSSSGLETNIVFVVRPKVLGSFSNTAVILATNTWQAYNAYPKNGRFPPGSFYKPKPYGSVDTVTFNRPYRDPTKPGYAGLTEAFYNYVLSLIHFLEKHSYACEYLAEDDIWEKGSILPYKNLIFADHNEYITVDEQDNIIRFLEKGNNLIYCNGNPFYAQIKAAGDGRTLSLVWDGKDRGTSLFGSEKHLPYGRFYPSSKITGSSFKDNARKIEPFFLPYTVTKPNHWIYEGTGLKKGDRFGMFGDERDVTNDYSPSNIEVLAEAVWSDEMFIKYSKYRSRNKLDYINDRLRRDLAKIFIGQLIPSFLLSEEYKLKLRRYLIKPERVDLVSGQMVYYRHKNNGHVFSAGMNHWNWNMMPMDTLKENPVLSRILRNVLDRCKVSRSLPPEGS